MLFRTLAPDTQPGPPDAVAPPPGSDRRWSDGLAIAPMRRRHLRAVAAIEADSSSHPWSRSLFEGELRMPTSRHWLVARRGPQVIGFAGLMWTLEEGHVTNFAVHPDHRRSRVASRLLGSLCDDAAGLGVERVSLEVRVSNEAARSLYTRFGFAPVGVRRGYYNDNGEDALIMCVDDIGGAGFRSRLERMAGDPPAGDDRHEPREDRR